jgi:alkylhydroperoxidase family enzyme
VTLVAEGHVPDEVYTHVRQHFSEQELVNLTLAVVAINGWNRLAIKHDVTALDTADMVACRVLSADPVSNE